MWVLWFPNTKRQLYIHFCMNTRKYHMQSFWRHAGHFSFLRLHLLFAVLLTSGPPSGTEHGNTLQVQRAHPAHRKWWQRGGLLLAPPALVWVLGYLRWGWVGTTGLFPLHSCRILLFIDFFDNLTFSYANENVIKKCTCPKSLATPKNSNALNDSWLNISYFRYFCQVPNTETLAHLFIYYLNQFSHYTHSFQQSMV